MNIDQIEISILIAVQGFSYKQFNAFKKLTYEKPNIIVTYNRVVFIDLNILFQLEYSRSLLNNIQRLSFIF